MNEMINTAITEASNAFDITMMKISAVTEAASRQFDINCQEAELKVMEENGTYDDLKYLREAADSSLVQNIKKAMSKMKEAIIKFFSEMRDRILKVFADAKNSEAIKKIKQKIKLIPLFGRRKIEVEDYDGEVKVAGKHLSVMQRLKAKFKSGQNVTGDEITAAMNDYVEDHNSVVGVSNSKTMTVSNAVDAAEKMMNKASDITKANEKEAIDACDDITKSIDDARDPSIGEKIAHNITTILKNLQSDFMRWITGVLSKIKSAYHSIRKTSKDVEDAPSTNEATDEDPIDEFDDGMDTVLDSIDMGDDGADVLEAVLDKYAEAHNLVDDDEDSDNVLESVLDRYAETHNLNDANSMLSSAFDAYDEW